VRTSILVMVCVMAGCAADEPTRTTTTTGPVVHLDTDQFTGAPQIKEVLPDVCALAAQLPSGDICALMCDPDAMKAQLLAEGSQTGTCYEFSCTLPDASHALVGVCLPP